MAEYRSIKFQIFYFIISFYYQQFHVQTVTVKFTKIECQAYDKPFADFKKCYLKAIRRDTVSLHLHVRLQHQVPVNNVSVNAAFFIKSSNQRYQPFLYNTTTDFCKFLRNTNKLPFWKIIFAIIKSNSNINHTCPFNHDIIVENLVLDANMIKLIPFQSGDYLVVLRVAAYNDYKAEVRVYVLIKE